MPSTRAIDMRYIVLDLEWNSAYDAKTEGYINEIIEIGAVALNDAFSETNAFSMLVRPQIGKQLRSHVTKLTGIHSGEVRNGLPFNEAIALFQAFVRGDDSERVVVSWGDGDLRVLLQNCRALFGDADLTWLGYYLDLQLYFQKKHKLSAAQQEGLKAAAERCGLRAENYEQHRALGDSRLTADILRCSYSQKEFQAQIKLCKRTFFEALEYKPRMLTDIDNVLVDKDELYYDCGRCGASCERLSEWHFNGRGFLALYCCPVCGRYAKATVALKKRYDHVEVKRSEREVDG
jgi:inhibitor of KinA sporulation pathway (predicted exonuclease)